MKYKRILAGLMTCTTMMVAIPGMTAFAYSGDEPGTTAVVTSAAETTASASEEIIDISDEIDGEFTIDSSLEFSQEDIMALMGLFLGETGSLADNPIGTVTGVNSYLNVRDGAGTEYQVLMHLLNGQQVEVTGEEGDWYQITIPAQVGYVYKDYLNVANKNPDGSFNITIDQEALDSLMEIAMNLLFSDSSSNVALTPDGNLTLVDDIGSSTGAGQQFITMVTKSGNYFYLIIDRNDKGEENVHFLNMVDEADLFALMDEDQQAAYLESHNTNKQDTTTITPVDTEPEKTEPEVEDQTVKEKSKVNFLPVIGVLALLGLAGGGFFLTQAKKKKTTSDRPDPDADYTEDDEDEYEFPEDDEEEIIDTVELEELEVPEDEE